MTDYNLKIEFSDDALKLVDSGKQTVVIAKPPAGGQTGNPVWVEVNPFDPGTINWNEDYSVYSSAPGADQTATTAETPTEPGIDLTPESDLFIA